MPTDVTLGPLRFITVLGDIPRTLGDGVETVGRQVRPAEAKARPIKITLPVRAAAAENADPHAAGLRLRRQVEALLDNDAARLQGLYFHWAADPEAAGWIVVGTGELEQATGGPSFADYKFTLDGFRVATTRSHREARRLEAFDRRLPTTPRDALGRIFGGDFAARTARTVLALPAAAGELVGPSGRPLTVNETRGVTPVVVGQPARAVVSFERDPLAADPGDVLAWDRRLGLTNRQPGGSFELSTEQWTAGASSAGMPVTVLERSNVWDPDGSWSLHAIINRNDGGTGVVRAPAGVSGVPVVGGQVLPWHMWLRVDQPGASPTQLAIYWYKTDGTASATATTTLWTSVLGFTGTQELSSEVTVPPDAAFAAIAATNGMGGAGDLSTWEIYLDSVALGTSAYFNGGTPGGHWLGSAHASPSVAPGVWEQIHGPGQPLVAGVPLLENGLCRVRWEPTRGVLVVDDGTSVEAGRVAVFASGGYATVLKGADVVECTPERTVVRLGLATSGVTRGDCYVSLQRGWRGPRVECYAATPTGLVAPSLIVSTTATAADPFVRSTGGGTITAGTDHGTWAGLEPWLHLAPALGLHLVLTAAREADRLLGVSGTQLYGGAARTAAEIRGQADGYVGATIEPAATSAVATARRGLAGQESLIDCRQVRELVSRS